MKIKVLYSEKYKVLGVMDGRACPSEDFLNDGEDDTYASRQGLKIFLEKVAESGLDGCPSAWFKVANKAEGIYEFKKGRLRLFFFRGQGNSIAICTTGNVKKTQKADRSSINAAIEYRKEYKTALKDNTLEMVEDYED